MLFRGDSYLRQRLNIGALPNPLNHHIPTDANKRLHIMHLSKYFIKFKYLDQKRTQYIKARSKQEAFIKLLKANNVNCISSMTIEGDPLPTRQDIAAQLIKKKEQIKEKRRKSAIKYYQMTGKSVFDK